MNRSIAAEGRRIGRYLLGEEPAEELVERYCEADAALFADSPSEEDRAVLGFVARHPWSLSPLEAALGLIRPSARLRRKVVVMAAILETSPRHAADFEPSSPGLVMALLRLAALGAASTAKVGLGLVVYAIARLGRVDGESDEG